jgi:hypothetical protein
VIAMLNISRIFKLIIVGLLGALFVACGQVQRPTVASAKPEGREVSHPSQATSQEVADEARIRQLIAKLSKQDQSESAQNELLEIAKKSSYNRDRVVQDLIADVKTHERVNGQHLVLGESFDYWDRATRIFRRLEATEAIEVMIQCIFCGNGMTGSFEESPAFDVLHAMGEKAIPKLSEALGRYPKDIVRGYVALCLGNIGGPEAKKALQSALRTETDPNVIRDIKTGLATIANSSPTLQ